MLAEGLTWLRDQLEFHEAIDVEARIVPAIGDAFTVSVIPRAIRGQEQFGDADNETKLLTAVIYIARSEFTAEGITEPPTMATVDVYGLEGWAINLAETDWGEVLVKLGLHRETLLREWQARRATV